MTGYPEGCWVETPYPLTEEQAHGPRESWPWLPGWVSGVCGPDEWLITVQVPGLAELEDGTPAPEGTPEEEAFYPGCFRDASPDALRSSSENSLPSSSPGSSPSSPPNSPPNGSPDSRPDSSPDSLPDSLRGNPPNCSPDSLPNSLPKSLGDGVGEEAK